MKSYQTTFSIKRLWIILSVGMVVMFGILLLLGQQIYQQAPPIPEAVKSASGETLFTRADIEAGQNIWQSIGGMQQGSIWGHGSYLAPDWSADWLHREAEALLALSTSPVPEGYPRRKRRRCERPRCRRKCAGTPMTPHPAS
jgi:nitric oxide reductase subunit B